MANGLEGSLVLVILYLIFIVQNKKSLSNLMGNITIHPKAE